MNVHDEDAAAALEALATVEDDYRSTILADRKLSIAYATESFMASRAVPNVDLHDSGPPGRSRTTPQTPSNPRVRLASQPCSISAGALAMAA